MPALGNPIRSALKLLKHRLQAPLAKSLPIDVRGARIYLKEKWNTRTLDG